MRRGLNQQLGDFLRKQRGKATYAEFSRKVGVSAASLCRIENGQQSMTLHKLEQVLRRLKCKMSDVFPPGG